MSVKFSLLGRVSLDDNFQELWSESMPVAGSMVVFPPSLPNTAGLEVVLQVEPEDCGVSFGFLGAKPHEQAGEAAATVFERRSQVYGVMEHQSLQVPVRGTAIAIVDIGSADPFRNFVRG